MPVNQPYEEKELLLLVAGGDMPAFQRLYDAYWNTVYSTALAYTQSHHAATEIVQETFTRVWKSRRKLPEVKDLAAYIFVIARNRIKSLLKQHRSCLSVDKFYYLEDTAADPGREAALRQFVALVHEATNLLPPQQAAVFRLSRFEQLDYSEISERLNISVPTVRNHLVKALGFLRNYFAERYKDLLHLLPWLIFILF